MINNIQKYLLAG